MARIPLLVGNWKMNGTYGACVQLAQLTVDKLERPWAHTSQIVMCPPFTALRGVSNVIAFEHSFAQVGAQDVYWEESGAYTGAISPAMLAELDCQWCIVGHSERRSLFGETDANVAKKCTALLEHGITPIVCVGESLEVYERGETQEFVKAQVLASLAGVEPGIRDIVVAYEPVWAIGSGKTPTPEHAQSVASVIRSAVASLWGDEKAQKVRVLYGGSVKPANSALFTSCPDVDGVLVGGASLNADSFVELVRKVLDA